MKILLLSIRSLMRFRLYTAINIFGLALSLACTLVICRYLYSEFTTDHFNSNHERICLSARVMKDKSILCTTDNIMLIPQYQNPLDIPEVEKKTSFVSLSDVTIQVDSKNWGAQVIATDSIFLQIFDFPILIGSKNQAFANPKSAYISQAFAKKIFGKENPIGKNIQYNEHLLTVEGITGEPSTPSSFSFDILISKELQWRWPPMNFNSAALMVPGFNVESINAKIKAKYNPEARKGFLFELLPLDQLYFDTGINKGENVFRQGNNKSLYILSIVAGLILLTGIFNFIQICTVVIYKRNRELGMKKVFGARPLQLFTQLYVENLFLTALALFLAWVLIEATHNFQVNVLQIKSIIPVAFSLSASLLLLFCLPLVVTIYPFIHYSRQTSIAIQRVTPAKHRMGIRSLFLITQYGITCCMIIVSLFFMKQLTFMLNNEPGYQTEGIIKVWFQRPSSAMVYSPETISKIEKTNSYILNKIHSSPLFNACCFGISPYEFPLSRFNHTSARKPGGDWQDVLLLKVSEDFFSLYQIPIKGSLPVGENDILINESAQKLFGSSEIEHNKLGDITVCSVKGTIPNIRTTHLSQQDLPLILTVAKEDAFQQNKLMVSFLPQQEKKVLQYLKELHKEVIGGDFEYSFVEDEYKALYEQDKQITIIYSLFAIIAIFISALGLFGLSLFDVQQRYREIAIRKVNGATISVIMQMLLKKYYRLLAIAFVVATPIAWLGIHQYLENFAHKAPVSWWLFAVALLITGGISLATLVWQIRKAARTNPVRAIQSE